ncbi:LysR family transcriptional regulator [Mycolicibacterium komossense]|uniref:LysR family transcriptional regulator n=1 Tax=Mycolicibacterium komossense TaxID=1779 RepID=A0ABT3CDX3_9MYCO|nr:LysR family transcriptional regulator [Mycolicibacterium komossense]MCV7227679.1 LysR family transcriptional regulator [Mycolicibacterium komossense]
MDLQQLHCFIAVAEEGTFTGAAKRMHLAQSGVSAHVKALERDVGQQLFERRPRSVALTAAGAALLPHVRTVMDALAQGRASVSGLTGLLHGRVAIGTITSISPRSIDLPEVLSSFHGRHPGVDLSLVEDTAAMLARRISDGLLEVAFTSVTEETVIPGMQVRELVREPVIAVFLASDSLAACRELPLSALTERPLIALSEGSGLRWELNRALRQAEVGVRIAFEASDPDVLVALVEKGLGVALVPESALTHSDRIVGVKVTDLPPGRLGIIWRDGAAISPAARAFVEHATEMTTSPRGKPRNAGESARGD